MMMTKQIPDKIDVFNIQENIVNSTIKYLQDIGEQRKEGIAYWTGKLEGSTALVNNTIFPGEYVESDDSEADSEFHASVSLSTAFKVGEIIHERNEILLVQIHTHPYEAFHSLTDNKYPISHRLGFISIVVPYFGRNIVNLDHCKIYEYKGAGNWRELKKNEIKNRFVINKGMNKI